MFRIGDLVRKIKGSSWEGYVVGHYSTATTPHGVVVESRFHKGSVQLYPDIALELLDTEEPPLEI